MAQLSATLRVVLGLVHFFGAITLASLKATINLRKILIAAIAIFAVGLLFFSNSHTLKFAFFFATITGFGMMMQIAIINTLLQTTSSIEMRGRVVSYFAMALFGMQPLGALMVGTLSHYIGAEHTITLQGLIAVIILIVFLPRLRKNL